MYIINSCSNECYLFLPCLFAFEGLDCHASVAVSLGQISKCDHAVTLLDQVQYCDVDAATLTEVPCSVLHMQVNMIHSQPHLLRLTSRCTSVCMVSLFASNPFKRIISVSCLDCKALMAS